MTAPGPRRCGVSGAALGDLGNRGRSLRDIDPKFRGATPAAAMRLLEAEAARSTVQLSSDGGAPLSTAVRRRDGAVAGPGVSPRIIGLAVSGGGDSMAMLYLAHNWTRAFGVRLWVVTIDHGLRPESAVRGKPWWLRNVQLLGWPHADTAVALGRHRVMCRTWHARRARLELIDRWRGEREACAFCAYARRSGGNGMLLRLARGSGVDGLAGDAASARGVLASAGVRRSGPGRRQDSDRRLHLRAQ